MIAINRLKRSIDDDFEDDRGPHRPDACRARRRHSAEPRLLSRPGRGGLARPGTRPGVGHPHVRRRACHRACAQSLGERMAGGRDRDRLARAPRRPRANAVPCPAEQGGACTCPAYRHRRSAGDRALGGRRLSLLQSLWARMSADPYKTLGVEKDATQEEIQKAYRGLAKKLHPDLNPGNKKAEEQFKEVAAAYDLLGDADKRGRFDRGEIDASGAERPRQRYYKDFAESGASHPYASDAGFADYASADEVLSEIFGRGGRVNLRMRGQDVQYRLALDFLDAINGAKRQVTLPDGTVLDVTIPPGTRDGQTLRLRGKGTPGLGDGPPGDALV